MSSHGDAIDAVDLTNLRQLRDLWSHADPVPAGLGERIKFEITVQALHAEVAELMDSALLSTRGAAAPTDPDTGSQSGDPTRREPTRTESVTFTAASVSLMISAAPSAAHEGRVRIDGWVTAPGAQVEAVRSDGSSSVSSDANGRFVLDDLPHGPVHFVIRTGSQAEPGGAAAETSSSAPPEAGDTVNRPVITPTIEI